MPIAPFAILSLGRKNSHNVGAFDVTEQIMADVVETFGAVAPLRIVAGHPPEEKEPEFQLGRVASLDRRAALLYVVPTDVEMAAVAAVNSRQMNRVSVKLRPPDHPLNKLGKWILMHVGLFGRTPTADRNLPDVEFADAESGDIYLSEFNPNENGLSGTGGGNAPSILAQPQTPNPTGAMSDELKDAELAAKQAGLEAKEVELAAKAARFERVQKITPFLQERVTNCQIHPGAVAAWQQVFGLLEPTQEIEFAQGDETVTEPAEAFLKRHLKELKPFYTRKEAAPADPEFAEGDDTPAPDAARQAARRSYADARREA
ncbi:MAG: hypothetical protein ACFB0C_19545 [Leptolyngbyaceae cyanobacterium]